MTDYRDIPMKAEAVRALMHERLGVRGRDLAQTAKRGGRLLPRRLRREVAVLVAADRAARSPKTAKQIDRQAVLRAYDLVTLHLRGINVTAQRRERLMRVLAGIAFQVLLIVAAFVVYLWWRGYV
jgi:hypothetical protein